MALGLTLSGVVAASAVAFLLCGVVVVVFIAYLYLLSGTGSDTKRTPVDGEDLELGSDDAVAASKEADVRRYCSEEVEILLAEAVVIGEGGFSTVYLSCSLHAAIKVYAGGGELPRRAFRQELDVLRRLRHPRIVRLLGYSDDCGALKEQEGVLVLEYAQNGTLHEKLNGSGGGSSLPWSARTRIAYEVAGAVEYLHDGGSEGEYNLPIVHGDLTAANVLLDADLGPKLCDFGSARVGFSSALRPSAPVLGSPGYTDPHYLRTGIASKKTDVYGFGVLLLELLTGRPAAGAEGRRTLAAEMAGGGAAEAVDPRMGGEHDAAEVAAVAAIAAACVGAQPTLRPSMAEIRRMMREKVPSSIAAVDGRSHGHNKLEEKNIVTSIRGT